MQAQLSSECFDEFVKLTYQLTGVTIASYRVSMIEGRLQKRLFDLSLCSYEAYLSFLKKDKQEQNLFIHLVTTHETYFFRTPRIWEYLESQFLPLWYQSYPQKTFRVWSAAASSGEEAYSLGVICQQFKEKNSHFSYQIVGTDISEQMIFLCQKAQYKGRSVEFFQSFRPLLFKKYLHPVNAKEFEIDEKIRACVGFHQHNLFSSFLTKDVFDLILLRNVLIYFSSSDQEKVLSCLSSRLSPEGLLIIGESESLSHIKTPYKYQQPLIYQLDPLYKRESA